MERPYHPALARLAAQHDAVIEEFQAGRMTAQEARRRVSLLAARDDTGIEWSIDPDTGRWRFLSSSGEFRFAEPPSFGIDAGTAASAGSARQRRGQDRVTHHVVPEEMLGRRLTPESGGEGRLSGGRTGSGPVRGAVVLAALAVVSAAAAFLLL